MFNFYNGYNNYWQKNAKLLNWNLQVETAKWRARALALEYENKVLKEHLEYYVKCAAQYGYPFEVLLKQQVGNVSVSNNSSDVKGPAKDVGKEGSKLTNKNLYSVGETEEKTEQASSDECLLERSVGSDYDSNFCPSDIHDDEVTSVLRTPCSSSESSCSLDEHLRESKNINEPEHEEGEEEDEYEYEFEIDDGMMEMIAISMRHKLELNASRRENVRSNFADSGEDPDSEKKNPTMNASRHEKVRSNFADSSEDPVSEEKNPTMNPRFLEEIKDRSKMYQELFGSKLKDIIRAESELQSEVEEKCQQLEAVFWPDLPLDLSF